MLKPFEPWRCPYVEPLIYGDEELMYDGNFDAEPNDEETLTWYIEEALGQVHKQS